MPQHRRNYSNLRPDQDAILYPMLGYKTADSSDWRIHVHGRVYRTSKVPFSTRLLVRGLKRAIKLPESELDSDIFRHRISGFLVKPASGRRIVISVGSTNFRLRRRSRGSGQFYGTLRIKNDMISELVEDEATSPRTISIQVKTKHNDVSEAHQGRVMLVEPRGISVVSDIDDTIKLTHVTNRRAMLAHTFVHPFETIPGMADLYHHWSRQGAFFHYVSSSPWQLYQPLAELCQEGEFPCGTMHLRWFRLRDEFFRKWLLLRRRGKGAIISNLMKRLPQRSFVLVGDSGERDPEIYARLARQYPHQVAAIYIREITDRPIDEKRLGSLAKHFRNTPFQVFREPQEIFNGLSMIAT